MANDSFEVYDLKDASGALLHNQMLIDGMRTSTFRKPPEVTAAIIRNIKNIKIRDDDVMLCTPVKSGKTFSLLTCRKNKFLVLRTTARDDCFQKFSFDFRNRFFFNQICNL